MSIEQWKTVPGWPLLEASTHGRVRTIQHHVLTSRKPKAFREYPKVSVTVDPTKKWNKGRYKSVALHRLIAATFLGPCPDGYEVNHIDGDKGNARPENLEYTTRAGNMLHVHRALKTPNMKKGASHYRAKLTDTDVIRIRHLRSQGITFTRLAFEFGVRKGTIQFICEGKTWKHLLIGSAH